MKRLRAGEGNGHSRPSSFPLPTPPSPSTSTPSSLGFFEQHTRGIGSKLMLNMGWKGGGIGAHETGIVTPLVPLPREPLRPVVLGDQFYAPPEAPPQPFRSDSSSSLHSNYGGNFDRNYGGDNGSDSNNFLGRDFEAHESSSSRSRGFLEAPRGSGSEDRMDLSSDSEMEHKGILELPDMEIDSALSSNSRKDLRKLEAEAALLKAKFFASSEAQLEALRIRIRESFLLLHRSIFNYCNSLKPSNGHISFSVEEALLETPIPSDSEFEVLETPKVSSWKLTTQKEFDRLKALKISIFGTFSEMESPRVKFDSIRTQFGDLLDEFDSEYENLRLGLVEFDCLALISFRDFQKWKFDISSFGNFSDDVSYFGDKLARHKRILKGLMDYHSMDLFSLLFERFCPALLEDHIFQIWKPGNCDRECVELMTHFGKTLNLDGLIETKVIERIKARVSEWEVSEPLETLSFLKIWFDSELISEEDIILILFGKLKSVFGNSTWDVSDPSPRLFLNLMLEISPTLVDYLIDFGVIPRLRSYWENALQINPRGQDLGPFLAVSEWRDLIRDSAFLDLCDSLFFPRFLLSLSTWLDNLNLSDLELRKTAQSEVSTWYDGWKGLFSSMDLLYPEVLIQFNRALHLISLKFFPKS